MLNRSFIVICAALLVVVFYAIAQAQPPQIQGGLSYLSSSQNQDGTWGNDASIGETTAVTAAGIEALKSLSQTSGSSYSGATAWMQSQSPASVDYQAQRIHALGLTDTSINALIPLLDQVHFAWGGDDGYDTDNLDTASGLLALKGSNYTDQALIFAVINNLLTTQNADGGWGFVQGDSSDSTVYTTSQVLYSLSQYKTTYLMNQQLSNAAAFLLSKQNADGGFGTGSSTVYETALALIALIEIGQTQGAPLLNAISYLTATQAADGSWNEDPYPTALALRALSYVKPDLSILPAGIAVLPAAPTVGGSITVTASVANLGLDTASGVTVRLLDNGVTAGDRTIASIAPGATGQAAFTISSLNPSGEHILTISLDPGNAIAEISKANNSATTRIWAQALADLVVLPDYLSLAPAFPKPAQSTTLTFQIGNMGESAANNVAAYLYDGDPASGGVKIGNSTVSSVPAGGLASGTITFSLAAAGSHNLYLVADPLHAIAESSVANNTAQKTVTVSTTGGNSLADLTIPFGGLQITPARPKNGDSTSIAIEARNLGTVSATALLELFDGLPTSGGTLLHQESVTLNPGESRSIAVPWTATPGSHSLYAVLDRAGLVPETDKTNNSQTFFIMTDMVDIAISASDININPEYPMDGDAATVNAVIQNRGINPTGAFNVKLYNGDPASGGTLLQSFAITSLAGDATQTVSYPFSAARGTYRFYVVCDPENSVIESDKTNNLAVRTLLVKSSADAKGPDLVPLAFDLSGASTDPQTLRISGTATVRFQNKGDDKVSTPFRITVFEDRDGDGLYTEGTDLSLGYWDYAAPMNPNMAGEVTINLAGTVTFRDSPIYAMLDSGQAVFEQNKDNNSIRKGSACESRPSSTVQPVLKWQWRGGRTSCPEFDISPPIVIGLTDDNGDGKIDEKDAPSIVFITKNKDYCLNTDYGSGMLKALNGKTRQEIFSYSNAAHPMQTGDFVTAGDINNNGKPEILVQGSNHGLLNFSNDGHLLWDNIDTISPWSASHWPYVLNITPFAITKIADLDGSGQPVIVSGATVLNADGSIRSTRSLYWGTGFGGNSVGSSGGSAVADLDMDGKQEIVVGNAAYNSDGTVKWYNPAVPDGPVVIANFDGDPYPEILVRSDATSGRSDLLYLLDHNGKIKWGPVGVADLEGAYPYNYGGIPTVADFDGDGELEIGFKGRNNYFIFDKNGRLKRTIATPLIGNAPRYEAATVFDLNGDGHPEIIMHSETYLQIYDGKTGTLLYTERPGTGGNFGSANVYQGVIVADVDGDGHAELVVTGLDIFSGGGSEQWLRVYGAKNNDWQGTRRVWNQPGYHVTNVNDNGSIPRYEAPSWLTNNNYLCNVPTTTGPDPYLAVDLSASFVRVDMARYPASVAITARVGNGGAKAVPAGVRTAFYDGDPASGGVLIGSALTTVPLNPGDYQDVALVWNAPSAGNHTVQAVADADNTQAECDKTNNSVSLPVFITSGIPDLSVAANDIVAPAAIPEGSLAPILVTVRNLGTVQADNVLVRLYAGNPSSGGKQIGSDQIVPSIAAGGATTLSTTWNTLGAAGVSYLYALVDPALTTADANRGNNTAFRQTTVSAALKPDLQIGAGDISVTPAAPREGDTLTINASIHNLGSLAGNIKVALYDGLPAAGGIKRAETTIAQLLVQGASAGAGFTLDSTSLGGSHTFYVCVDPDNSIDESDKTNNQASRSVTISAAGLAASIYTSKGAYGANEAVPVSLSVNELSGTARSLVYDLLVSDASGVQAALLPEVALPLGASAGVNLSIPWNTGTTFAGSYTVTVRIKENSRIIAKASAAISITPVKSADAGITVDKISYRSNEQVAINATLTGTSPNYIFSALTAAISVADSSGKSLLSTTRTVASLAGGQRVALNSYWNTVTSPSGSYLVSLQILDGATVVNSANTSFTITGSAAAGDGLTGTVTAPAAPVEAGGDAALTYSIANLGNQDLAAFDLNLLIVDPASGQLLKTINAGSGLSLAMAGSQTGAVTFVTGGIAPKTLLAVLQYGFQGTVKSLASAPFNVTDTTAPLLTVSTLADGAYTNNPVLNVSGLAADASGIKSLAINGLDTTPNQDGSFSQALVLQPGPNAVSIVATDLAGNASSDNRIVNLDLTAPQISITAPSDNDNTAAAALTVTGTVSETSTVTVKLGDVIQNAVIDGTAFSASVNLSPGLNTIEVTATDPASNASTLKRTVIYDNRKPSLSISSPAQDTQTKEALLTVSGSTADPYSPVSITVSVDGQTFNPPVADGAFEQVVSLSAEKTYSIIVTATNLAGSATSVQRNVIFDQTPPALGIIPVPSPTNQGNQILSGTMEAGATVVLIADSTASLGAVTYPTATSWSCAVHGLPEGTSNFTAVASDAAGNSATALAAITLDTIPPAVRIDSPVSGYLRNNQPPLNYEVSDGTVLVQVDGAAVQVLPGQPLGPLAEGLHSVLVQATDAAGNAGSATLTFTVDTVPPAVTINPAVSPTRSASQVLSGTVEAGAAISLSANTGAWIGALNYPAPGTWSCPVTGLAPGSNAVSVTASDPAGNRASATVSISYFPPLAARITPAEITNLYQGAVTLAVSDLYTPGSEALVEQFVDANRNGVIDAGDFPVRTFKLSDGTASINANIPGDEDCSVNSSILTSLNYYLLNDLYHAPGQYLFRVTSGTDSAVASLSVSPAPQNQGISGKVFVDSVPVPGAMLQLTDKWQRPIAYTLADTAGRYAFNLKDPGAYSVYALSYGFAASAASSPVLVAAGQNVLDQDVALSAGAFSATGQVKDAASGAGIDGVWVRATGSSYAGTAMTGADGSYSLSLPAGQFSIAVVADPTVPNPSGKGYLAFEEQSQTANVSADLVVPDIKLPRATVLLSGRALDGQGGAVPGIPVQGESAGGLDLLKPAGYGVTNAQGDYTLALCSGAGWDLGPHDASAQSLGYLGNSIGNVSTLTGSSTGNDLTVHPITAWVQGTVKDSNGNLIAGASIQLRSADSSIVTRVQSAADGSYRMGAYQGSWLVDDITHNKKNQTLEQGVALSDGQTVTVDFIVDVTAPALAIDPVVTPTTSNFQVVTGSVEAGSTIEVAVDTSAVAGAIRYPTQTTWSVSITGLVAGDTGNHVVVTATDAAGNSTVATTQILFVQTYGISAAAGSNGSVSPAGNTTVASGSSQSFTILPNSGYSIADVTVDGVSHGPITSYTFSDVTAAHTIAATFAINSYTITATAGSGGAVTPALATVNYGGSQTVSITANTGYHVTGVTVDGASQGALTSYSFANVTAAHEIAASFAINSYTITATAGSGGVVTPASATVNNGGSQIVSIAPNAGYSIASVTVDGVPQGAIAGYTFSNVTAAHTIAASFALTQQSTFSYALFGSKSVSMTGGSYTDSYVGSPGSVVMGQVKNGDIGTNSLLSCAIQITGGAQVFGRAWDGTGGNPATGICLSAGTIYNNQEGALTAAIDMTPKAEPSPGASLGALSLANGVSKTLSAGSYHYTSVNLTGGTTLTLNGAITLHIDGNLTISNGSKIVIASGSATLYVNGQKIDITGGAIVNSTQDPRNLTVYGGSGLQTVSLSGGANLYGQIFAPAATITISGGQVTFGSLVGSAINMSNGAAVHFDANP